VDGRDLLTLFSDGRLRQADAWPDDLMRETHRHHWEKIVGRSLVTRRYLYSGYRFLEIPSYVRESDDLTNMDELYDLDGDPFQLHNLGRHPAAAGYSL